MTCPAWWAGGEALRVRWWCFAQQEAWSWTWRPYVGVWVLVGLLAWGYVRLRRGQGEEGGGPGRGPEGEPWWRTASFASGLVLLWVSLDWPLGPLGAGYFASLHMVQYVAVGVAAPALLLLGLPGRTYGRLAEGPWRGEVLRTLTHPLPAFAVFNGVMVVTHWPSVVDALMPTPWGSFLLDASWLLAGLLFWWPVVAPVPARPGFTPLARMGYLALNAFLIRPPFAMMVFGEEPLYRIYELAPPPAPDALDDQQLAGVVMKIGVAWVMFAGVAALFLGWVREEERQAGPGPGSG